MASDFKVNGREIPEPTEFGWNPRNVVDVQGDNRPIYPGVRSFILKWDLISYEDWAGMQDLYDGIASTGTAVVTLPAFPTATGTSYAFREYSGVTIAEPVVGSFFQRHATKVTLLIANIVVE